MIEWIKSIRKTPRGKTAFKLSLYMIFLLFVLVILFIGGSFDKKTTTKSLHSTESTLEESTIVELTFLEKQYKLINEDFDFKYIITGEKTISYEGKKQNNIVKGYKESASELIHYEIENEKFYKTSLTQREEYTNLYENLDNRLFDLPLLFNELNTSTATIIKNNNDKIYNYTNIFDNYSIEVKTDDYEIKNIVIKNDTIEYNFAFEYKTKEGY